MCTSTCYKVLYFSISYYILVAWMIFFSFLLSGFKGFNMIDLLIKTIVKTSHYHHQQTNDPFIVDHHVTGKNIGFSWFWRLHFLQLWLADKKQAVNSSAISNSLPLAIVYVWIDLSYLQCFSKNAFLYVNCRHGNEANHLIEQLKKELHYLYVRYTVEFMICLPQRGSFYPCTASNPISILLEKQRLI